MLIFHFLCFGALLVFTLAGAAAVYDATAGLKGNWISVAILAVGLSAVLAITALDLL